MVRRRDEQDARDALGAAGRSQRGGERREHIDATEDARRGHWRHERHAHDAVVVINAIVVIVVIVVIVAIVAIRERDGDGDGIEVEWDGPGDHEGVQCRTVRVPGQDHDRWGGVMGVMRVPRACSRGVVFGGARAGHCALRAALCGVLCGVLCVMEPPNARHDRGDDAGRRAVCEKPASLSAERLRRERLRVVQRTGRGSRARVNVRQSFGEVEPPRPSSRRPLVAVQLLPSRSVARVVPSRVEHFLARLLLIMLIIIIIIGAVSTEPTEPESIEEHPRDGPAHVAGEKEPHPHVTLGLGEGLDERRVLLRPLVRRHCRRLRHVLRRRRAQRNCNSAPIRIGR